ncbi:hypothetical protein HTZ84_12570 [Haloterrigena sp. SYSU A558-1]|uniref:LexA-binding, inner membrane-associated hydrolase n=1 Tax=Haloterrigena gelatinilytica TaxID=2741724 RepID=A0ABX2LBN8_9EURY|nr:hypothetical protein [Haloterrigena gelatinilytica]NUC73136.1 hypothetical protein [Haloterrigena gelatinilytica]
MSLVVAGVLAAVLSPISVSGVELPAVAVVAYGTAVGVLIDVDHLLIARVKTGSWDAVRFCLANPIAAVADQGQIFEHGDVGVLSRLLSHLLIIGTVVPLLALASRSLAIVTGVVLYVHVVCDVVWDRWRLEDHAAKSATVNDLVRELR